VHPFVDLSAYLDGALEREQRAAVDAHLAACALCAARLTELRGIARLIAALPVPVPSRSLVPRVSVPIWLAPMRTLATVASGAAMLLFVASTLLANAPIAMPGAGSPASAPQRERDAAPGALPAPAPSPSADVRLSVGTATPSPGAAFSVQSAAPTRGLEDRSAAGATDAAKAQQSGDARGDTGAVDERALDYSATERRPLGPSPWAWLALAIVLGAFAFMLQRRLRTA
jgi:hypothetical protein